MFEFTPVWSIEIVMSVNFRGREIGKNRKTSDDDSRKSTHLTP